MIGPATSPRRLMLGLMLAPAFAGGLLLALAAGPLAAQGEPAAQGATSASPDAPASSEAGVEAARKLLNEQQAQFAAEQLQGNAENQAEYQRKLREIADSQAEAKAAYDAEVARRQQEYDAAMARWKADAAACEAGEVARCAPPAASPQ